MEKDRRRLFMGKIIVTGSATGMCIGERLGLKLGRFEF
jgi:hypothetical protein